MLLKSALNKYATDWALDGRFLMYTEFDPKTSGHVWVLPLSGNRKPIPFLKTEFNEAWGVFSPDGKWVAYSSDESGRWKVYVRPFAGAETPFAGLDPRTLGKWQISNKGFVPRWRRDGKELVYKDLSNLMAVKLRTMPTFEPGAPQLLFAPPFGMYGASNFAVTADGRRFLVRIPVDFASTPATVVLNWTRQLRP